MENVRFHSPFFLFVLMLLCGCVSDKDHRNTQVKKDLVRSGYAFQLKADSLFHAGEADSAFANYERAKKLYQDGQDSLRTVYTLLQQGELYKIYNDYREMQATDVEALKYLETTRDSTYQPSVYNQFGISYAMLDDLEAATANYYKGRSYVSRDWELATIANNVAYAHIFKGNYAKANTILASTIQKYALHDSVPIKATLLDNIGYTTFRLGRPGGEASVRKALSLRKASADSSGLITNYLHLAELSPDKEQLLKFASEAEQLARILDAPEDRLEALRLLINHASERQIAVFSRNYIRIADSLERARLKARTAFAKIKYDVRRHEEARMKAEIDQIRERNEKLVWIIVLVIFIFGSAITVYFLVRRSKNIRKKATYEAEVRISTKLHDELANEVHKTIVFAETRNLAQAANQETLLQRLEIIYEGTRSISRDNSEIPEGDFGNSLRELLQEYNSDDCAVIAQGIANVNWDKLSRHGQFEFFRIVQELLANMRKHSECSHALFLFGMNGKNMTLTYSDNGRGRSDKQNRKNGLRIMENRISALKGSATFESTPGNGFRAHVQFPL